jgi:hypothetical protein
VFRVVDMARSSMVESSAFSIQKFECTLINNLLAAFRLQIGYIRSLVYIFVETIQTLIHSLLREKGMIFAKFPVFSAGIGRIFINGYVGNLLRLYRDLVKDAPRGKLNGLHNAPKLLFRSILPS